MMLTMAYLLLIAALMGLAAHLGERLCVELGWPRRSAWLVALVASMVLPAFALLYGATPSTATPVLSLPPLLDQIPAIGRGSAITATETAAATAFNWPDWRAFDSTLAALWILSSGALLLLYLLAAWRVRGITRRAQSFAIGNRTVLVSDRLGPAVLGFFKARIVLPRWLAEQDSGLRSQVLNHEGEHIAAHDQLALLAGLLLVAVMPWNIALWWQLRRLRAAMEVDCDHRVLRAGADARDYSKALLTVGQRGLGAPFGALALTEPVSELERRIRIMLDKARDFSLAGFGARFLVVVSVLGLAVAVNAPKAQQAADSGEAASTPEVLPVIRLSIGEQISEAQACIKQEDMECAHRILDEIGETPDLNAYEAATLQNLLAYTDYQEDNLAGAITAYETILALPQDGLPEGLVSAAMRSLSILYVGADRLQDGLYLYDRYLALPYVDASGEDYFLKASILYQLERYPDALAETERAIATTDEPREAWYELLYGLQSTTGDEQGAARTLEILNTRWPNEERASSAAAAAPERSTVRGGDFGLSDGEYLPVFIAQPIYPPRARARGLEGYVVVRYTVTTTGTPKDIEVIESSTPTLFDHAAIEAVRQYEYKPRVVDGIPVEVAGVTSRIVFDGTL